MKIGIVCYPTFGGSGVVATELGIELSNKGHEVHFITYSQPVRLEALTSNLYFHEVTVPEYPLFKYEPYELALSSKLYDVISKHKLDLLHVHYAIPHAYAGYKIPSQYDSMIGKIIVHAKNRESAIKKMERALEECIITGPKTTIPYQLQIMQNEKFKSGEFDTSFLETFNYKTK